MTLASTDRTAPQARKTALGAVIGVPFKVLTEAGTLRRASECYAGSAYPSGALLTALYRPLGKDEFCAGPEALGFDIHPSDFELFLARIGVALQVRRIQLKSPSDIWEAGLPSHVRQVLARLQYPQTLAERRFDSADEAYKALIVQYVGGTVPDRWEQVLRLGSAEAIIAYVASTGLQRLDDAQPSGIQFQARQGTQQAFRACLSVSVSDPTLFLLRETAWVPCDDDVRHLPRHVALTKLGRKALGRAFRAPQITVSSPILAAAGGSAAMLAVLNAAGAVQALESLRGDDLYALLLELPERDPDGEVAPSVYRSLVEAGQLEVTSPLRSDFLLRGRMWGEQGKLRNYHPIQALRYAARTGVPEPVRRHVPLVAIDARRSAAEVERVFGIKPLDPSDYEIAVDEVATEESSWSERAQRHLRSAVAHLYALRLFQRADDRGDERRAFAELGLIVTQRLVARVRVEDRMPETVVLDTDLAGLTSGRRAFVVSHDDSFSYDPVLWRAVADLAADVINVPRASGDFGPLLACATADQRTRLLDHMTAGSAARLLEQSHEALGTAGAFEELDDDLTVSVPAPRPLPSKSVSPASPPAAQSGEAGGAATQLTGEAGAVIATSPPASRASHPRELVVTSRPVGSASEQRTDGSVPRDEDDFANREFGARGGRVAEGDTLALAERFELLADPPRFVVNVAHLRGSAAFGCDLISLGSAEARDRVLHEGDVALDEVVRFIEVKGAGARSGTIELTDNEREAAEKFGTRYFVYRVYVDRARSGPAEIAVLCAPTTSPGERLSIRWAYSFSAASGAKWYRLPVDDNSPLRDIAAPASPEEDDAGAPDR